MRNECAVTRLKCQKRKKEKQTLAHIAKQVSGILLNRGILSVLKIPFYMIGWLFIRQQTG